MYLIKDLVFYNVEVKTKEELFLRIENVRF